MILIQTVNQGLWNRMKTKYGNKILQQLQLRNTTSQLAFNLPGNPIMTRHRINNQEGKERVSLKNSPSCVFFEI